MALPTYLDLVNNVLVRLREQEVTTVAENPLSKLIGKYINDAKRTVEDAYGWNALSSWVNTSTVATQDYVTLTGTNNRFKIMSVFNGDTKNFLEPVSRNAMFFHLNSTATPDAGSPMYYNVNGVDANGVAKVRLFPVPDAVYPVVFNVFDPQDNLVNDSDTMLVPEDPVTHLAYAKAVAERGEDGGIASSEAYVLYTQVLSDFIAIEQARNPEEDVWNAV